MLGKKIIALCLLLLATQAAWANRDYKYKDYSWVDNRPLHIIQPEDLLKPAVVLKHLVSHEYIYENEGNTLFIYSTEHKIIKVNTDDALEQHNKIYIPIAGVAEIVELKARSINPKGKLIVLDKSNIKEVKDEDGSRAYKIFAIEGAEKGSEIEYISIRKRYANFFGREFVQSGVAARNVDFELISPMNLEFTHKVYNGNAQVIDTTEGGKRLTRAHFTYVPALEQEAFAFYNPNRLRIEFKLTYNSNQGRKKLLTWADATRNLYDRYYKLSNAEEKAADKYFKSLKLKADASLEDKIRHIENQIKTSIAVQQSFQANLQDIKFITTNKFASQQGMTRLFLAMFKRAGVQHELVLTSDRTSIRFDGEFESWNYLDEFAIYVNATGKYLSPDNAGYRYGMIPAEMTHCDGLFIKEISLGGVSSAVGEVRFIPTLNHEQSYDNLDIRVKLEPGMDKADIQLKRLIAGYSSVFIQPYYTMIPEKVRRDAIEELVKSSVSDAEFKKLQVEGGEVNTSPLLKPFVIDAHVSSASLIERAGPKFLFKFGELLGPQSQLYQETERKSEIENQFNRSYNRIIRFEVPAQYQVKNLDDIRMNVEFSTDKGEICIFKSDYKLEGSLLTVNVTEYYKEIACRKEDFESFRKVINAAADFNKITLVLEKKL